MHLAIKRMRPSWFYVPLILISACAVIGDVYDVQCMTLDLTSEVSNQSGVKYQKCDRVSFCDGYKSSKHIGWTSSSMMSTNDIF